METQISYSSSISASINILESIKDLLDSISTKIYIEPDHILSGATLGQHFRHIIEFYQCIIDNSEDCLICYDNRKRDLRLEESIDAMIIRINNITYSIKNLDPDIPVQTLSKFTSDPLEKKVKINSSIGRELAYGFDHSIHHLAIVKIAMNINHPEIKLPAELGIAPSTIQYQSTCVH